MKIFVKTLIIQLIVFNTVCGQHNFKCGTDEVLKGNPVLQKIVENFEKDFRQKKQNLINATPDMTTVYTIPVVFHVYHLGEAVGTGSNMSDAAVQASVDRLNAVFRATGIHAGLTPDIKIQFVLASYDPNCQSTNGIVRVDGRSISGYSSGVPFSDYTMHQALRNLSTWDVNQYINIRICHTITGTGGFAYYLGDLFMPANSVNTYTNASGLDNFWAHEMGHSMNLYHTFYGDGTPNGGGTSPVSVCPVNNDPENDGDKVSDTDPHKNDDGCNHTAINSCTGNPFGDILKNIMSYSCTEKFTPKQMERMRFSLLNYRQSLISSKGITGLGLPPTASANSRCSPGSVTLAASGCNGTYNWYATNTGGNSLANGATFTTPIVNNTTTYYVNCTEGSCVSNRTPVQAIIKQNFDITCYCNTIQSNSAYQFGLKISKVNLGLLNNLSSCNSYGSTGSIPFFYNNYTELPVQNIPKSNLLNLNLNFENCSGPNAPSSAYSVKVFIDYNRNGIFGDSGEQVFFETNIGTNKLSVLSNISIPNNVLEGTTFLRVVLAQGWDIDTDGSCGFGYWGEMEDYKINIVGCTQPSAPIAPSVSNQCGAGTVTLTASGCSGTYNWYANSNGGSILSSGSSFVTPTINTSQTYYVNCTEGSCVSNRTPVQAIIANVLDIACYCTSMATETADEDILNVTIGNLNNSSTCSATGTTGSILNRYSNFTHLSPVNFAKGATVPYSIQVGTCGGNYGNSIKVFIDYNRNGSFDDAGETVIVSSGSVNGPHTITGTLTLPTNIPLGTTFMRVINVETVPSNINSCGNYAWGETEDYRINIVECSAPPSPMMTSASRCGTGTVMLTASGCNGTYNWYSAASGGNSLGTGGSFITPSLGSTTPYYVDCTVGSCVSSRSIVTATVIIIPTPTVNSPTINSGQTATLTASGCSGAVKWYNQQTGGMLVFTGNPYTTSSLTMNTFYYVSCTVNSCESSRGSATVTVNTCPNQPDLIISAVNITKYAPNRVNYAVTVKNQGSVNASLGSVSLGVFGSPDALRNANDVFKSALFAGGGTLAPNQTYTINDFAGFNFADANYYLAFTIDYHTLLAECNENNNDFVKLVNQCSGSGNNIVLGSLPNPFYAYNGTVIVPNIPQSSEPKLIVARAFTVNPNVSLFNVSLVVGNCLTVPTVASVAVDEITAAAPPSLGSVQVQNGQLLVENLSKEVNNISIWEADSGVLLQSKAFSPNTHSFVKGKKYIVRLESAQGLEGFVVEW